MLYGGLSVKDIKEGQSRPRNRAIASAFVAMRIIEQWGTGIPRIIEMCKEYGLREPEFIEMGMSFRVNLFRKQNEYKTQEHDGDSIMQEDSTYDKIKRQFVYSIKGSFKTVERALQVYEELHDEIFNRNDIMIVAGLSSNSAAYLINKLLVANLIIPVDGKGKYEFAISVD